MIQFLKRGGCGEHESAKTLGIAIHTGPDVSAPPWVASARAEWATHTAAQLARAHNLLQTSKSGVVILDELLGAMNAGHLREADVLSLMDSKPEEVELVITGRGATNAIVDKADLVTNMTKVKHYMDAGICAREGIEY